MNSFKINWTVFLFTIILISCCTMPAVWGQKEGKIHKNKTPKTAKNWKLGVSLYTFSNVSFPEQLALADSSGLKYVEGFVFAKAGIALQDSIIVRLSPSSIHQLKTEIDKKGLKMESIYLIGGKKIEDWKRDFEIAKHFGVQYVTAEPPKDLWDGVDSLAGVYGMKVALHNHWKETSIYWHPDSVLTAIKGHRNFAACPDLGHYPKSGINPLDAVKKLKGHIIGIHLKDIAEYNNIKIQDVPVGTGVIDFPTIFKELKKQKFNGYLIIERDTKEQPNNLNSVKQIIQYHNKVLKTMAN